jgi:hypothetical protein
MTQLASIEAEPALWASHNSVSRYVVRLYNYPKPKVVADLSKSTSKIHINFDRWTTKGGKRGYLGIVAHYVDSKGTLKDLPIALPQLIGRSAYIANPSEFPLGIFSHELHFTSMATLL